MPEFDRFSHDYESRLAGSLGGLGSVDSALSSKLVQLDAIFTLETGERMDTHLKQRMRPSGR